VVGIIVVLLVLIPIFLFIDYARANQIKMAAMMYVVDQLYDKSSGTASSVKTIGDMVREINKTGYEFERNRWTKDAISKLPMPIIMYRNSVEVIKKDLNIP